MIKFEHDFRYFIREHVKKDMMAQTIQDGILKSNHLLPNELFNLRKMRVN
jgi:hypothetical protein